MRVSGLALVLLALALAACGGGDDRLSRQELVSQADAICMDFERRIDELGEPQSLEALAEFAREAQPIFDEGLDELRELEPPEDLEETYGRWIATGDETADVLQELGEAAGDGDEAEVRRISERADDLDQRSDRLARRIGLKECAND